jgi:hypothetical protein
MPPRSRSARAPAPAGEARAERSLRAFDALEVGPVRVEPRRIVCPYRVGRATIDLIYRYEERVFDPRDPASQNLAAMIAAQVALNYGLFCRRIVLRGPFDRHDRAFLREMAENTAREIYVNKLLKPNLFLVGPVSRLRERPRPRKRYCAAALVFEGVAYAGKAGGRRPADSYAVLSSGGKESLLSQAMLEELGKPAHPIFVNESGRHWYTALNAYRYLAATQPNTARVWTNADRLFGWMLRRLPFIRPDFARLRSDDYPIRLWTVAVFVFGVLPLALKRGLGRIVIGCEIDTTREARLHGIPHYDGLYDQSVFFDRRLTEYYEKKGWALEQLSILRPTTELLIEKTLVERYPRLQREQVSCHATHIDARGRVRPCGRCEKCRRIVALLTAVGADARRCGYTAAQIAACLAALPAAGLAQEERDALLLKRLAADPGDAVAARALLGLRWDACRAPRDLLPRELRAPLVRLLRAHAAPAGYGRRQLMRTPSRPTS